MTRKLAAEFIGTFWLVLGGCGAAVLAAGFPKLGIGFVGVALAFGLTLLTMAFAIGGISGCHINPAVTVGLWAARRFPARDVLPYIAAQVVGGIVAGGVLYIIASGQAGFTTANGFASNGYGEVRCRAFSRLVRRTSRAAARAKKPEKETPGRARRSRRHLKTIVTRPRPPPATPTCAALR